MAVGERRDPDNSGLRKMIEEQRATLVEQRRLIHVGRKRLTQAMVGYLILVVSIAISLFVLESRQDEKLRASQTNACERVNILRGQVNVNSTVIYDVLKNAEKRERLLSRTSPVAERKAHRKSADNFRDILTRLSTTDSTNCLQAVDDPVGYVAPTPEPFR
jgi:hypothetical protein